MYNRWIKKFEWDENKNKLNIEKHSADFVDAVNIFEEQMFVCQDIRNEYGDERYIGIGLVKERIMVLVYAERSPNIIRFISFRKANKREQKRYEIELKNGLEAS